MIDHMLRKKLREYIKVCGAVNSMSDIIETANSYMLDQLAGDHSADEIAQIKVLNDKYMLLVQGRIDEFQEKFVELYAEYYTEQDVDALLVFHNSPVAQKQREVSGKLFARAIEISSDFNKELLKQLAGVTLDRQVN